MTHCPVWAQTLIHNMVLTDEGGWRLHSDSNDPDGGWTFGGVTAKLWRHYYPQDGKPDISTDEGRVQAIAKAKHIYWKEFVEKLLDVLGQVEPYMLSCAVNLGLDDVLRIEKLLGKGDSSDPQRRRDFCSLWAKTYIDMVQANAEAWKKWADWAKDRISDLTSEAEIIEWPAVGRPEPPRPTSLRARYLEGWLDRVNRYAQA